MQQCHMTLMRFRFPQREPRTTLAQGILLHSSADLIQRIEAEADDMEGVQHPGGVREGGAAARWRSRGTDPARPR